MEIVKYVGLVLFAFPFVAFGITHLVQREAMTGYAQYKGVPAAKTTVIATGIILIVAPILVIFGIVPKIALGALALFVLATAFKMHDFWNQEGDAKVTEQTSFNKNIGLAGAAIALIALL